MNYSKIRFYLSYIYYKIKIVVDVKNGKLNIAFAEIIWILNKILKTDFDLPNFLKRARYETIFGKFNITPDLISTITASPAFERKDIEYLIKLVRENNKMNPIFFDIGANFGLYTVIMGNRFKKMKIYAFEPGTEYLSLPAFGLLERNVKYNRLKNVKLFNYGIGSKSGKNSLGILTKRLDAALSADLYKKHAVAIIKLDIDDFVVDGLRGIDGVTVKFGKTYLLVEDFVKPKETVSYLKNHKYKFIAKLTPYNSFWMKKNE